MLLAVKQNTELTITENEVENYALNGFDIYKSEADRIELFRPATNKTVSYLEYEKLQEELKAAQEKLKEVLAKPAKDKKADSDSKKD